MAERYIGIDVIKPTSTPGVVRGVNFGLMGSVRAWELNRSKSNDDLGLDDLDPRTDDWYGAASGEKIVSLEEAAYREKVMKDWFDDAVERENDLDTDFPHLDGRPPCIASGLDD